MSISQVLLLIGALVLLKLLYNFYKQRWELIEKSKNIQWDVDGIPLVGIGHKFMKSDVQASFDYLSGLFARCPDIRRVFLGPKLFCVVSDADYVGRILNHPVALKKAHFYDFFAPLVGLGILTAAVSPWRRHRKVIAHSFNQKILNRYVDVIDRHARTAAVGKFRPGRQPEDVLLKNIVNCVTDVTCESFLDTEAEIQKKNSILGQRFDKVLDIFYQRCFKIWYYSDIVFKFFSPMYKDQEEHIGVIDSFIDQIITHHKSEYLKSAEADKSSHTIEDDDDNNKKPFISNLIDKRFKTYEFTDLEIRDEVSTMFVAATDTTSISACFLFTNLGMYQDIQEKVYAEILEVCGLSSPLTAEMLANLKYTERVIKESLRIFPTAPYILKETEKDLELTEDITIPEGSQIVLTFMNIHRNPKYWKDPLKFDPDRFLPEECLKHHPNSFLPFSGGPRNCIGAKWAVMVLKSLTVAVLREYRIFTDYKCAADVELKSNILLRAKNGFKLTLESRNSR